MANHPTDRNIGQSSPEKSDSGNDSNLFADLFSDSSFEPLNASSDTFSKDMAAAKDSLDAYRDGTIDSFSTANLFDGGANSESRGNDSIADSNAGLNLPEFSLFDESASNEPVTEAVAKAESETETEKPAELKESEQALEHLDEVAASRLPERPQSTRRDLVQSLAAVEKTSPQAKKDLTRLSERFSSTA